MTIIVIGSACFWNTLHNPFHLDDFYRVLDNPGVRRLHPIWRHFFDPSTNAQLPRLAQFRPLLPLTLSLNYYFSGGDSFPAYHLTNLAFQIGCGILAFFLASKLLAIFCENLPAGRRELAALFSALVFLVHPISGIPVNYICARDLVMMQFFMEGSLLAYLAARERDRPGAMLALSALLLLLSLFSKTNSVALPALLVALEFCIEPRSLARVKTWLRVLPHLCVILACFAYTKFVLAFSDFSNVVSNTYESPWVYPLTQMKLHLCEYFLNFIYPFPIRQAPYIVLETSIFSFPVVLGGLFILLTIGAAFLCLRRRPLFSFCIFAYWILMAPESSILPLVQIAADYRPYPSTFFLTLILADMVFRSLPVDTAVATGAVCVAYFGVATYFMNTTWRSEESLWSHAVEHGGSELAHLNLAMSIDDRRDPRVRGNLEEAIRIAPDYVVAHLDLGILLMDLGETEAGLAEVINATQLAPRSGQTHYWLGQAYLKIDRKAEALESLLTAARLDPNNINYQYSAGKLCAKLQNFGRCLEPLQKAADLDPEHKNVLFLKGYVEQMTDQIEPAIADYRRFLARYPHDAQTIYNLAYALKQREGCKSAVPLFEKSLSIDPAMRAAHFHLADCYRRAGDEAGADQELRIYNGGDSNTSGSK